MLGDSTDARELLEKAVHSVSTYLQKKGAEAHDPSGLLIVAVHRSARRLARNRGRLHVVGGSTELAEQLRAPDWVNDAERRIFVEQLVARLRPENRSILRLRLDDFSWQEIARMLQADPNIVRKEFWRDLRRAHLQLLQRPILKGPDAD
jgi:DNA-directed RNA polymerase specialized sigma24 family protein